MAGVFREAGNPLDAPVCERQKHDCPNLETPTAQMSLLRGTLTRNTLWRVSEKTVNGHAERTLVHNHCGRFNVKPFNKEEYEPVS